MSTTHHITRAAELESLPVFRGFIADACRQHPGVDAQTVYDLQLAVDEACTNIITHGYADMNPVSIILSLDLEPDRVVMTLTDFGHAFEPSATPAPDPGAALEERPTGGFGLYFIYQTMDSVDYRTADEAGNQLILIKRLRAPAGR